jgi:hypothetical protein
MAKEERFALTSLKNFYTNKPMTQEEMFRRVDECIEESSNDKNLEKIIKALADK